MLSRPFLSRLFRRPCPIEKPTRPSIQRQRSRPQLEALESRMVLYSASGNAWSAPQLITLSFMPDGTLINGKSSNLVSTFNARFGANAWQTTIEKAAQSWAAQTNINFAVVPDNGAANGTGNNQQGDPNFGDIRIGGYNFGSSTLAQAYMPPPVNNYSIAGDITFNTGQAYGSTYDLFTVATHELGHSLGLYHSGIASAEEYGSYTGSKSTLTGDDIAGIQSIYGGARKPDNYEVSGTNDQPSAASDLTSKISSTSLTAVVTGLDITAVSDVDYYKFTAPAGGNGNLTVSATAQGLSLLAPILSISDVNYHTLASDYSVGPYGGSKTLTIPAVTAGSTYIVRVAGANTTANGTGAYALTLNFGNNSTPAVPVPTTTIPNGSPLSAGGGQAVQVNQETLVNTTTNDTQTLDYNNEKAVAMDAHGNFVVTWQGHNQDGNGWGVYAQRFDVNGNKLGGEFRVNTTTNGDQTNPAVAMGADGAFVITWASSGQDGNGWGVYAQRYSASGVPQGGEFRVNTTTNGDQTYPTAAMDAAGDLTITWQSHDQDGNGWGIYARSYNALGVSPGGEFRVNTTTNGDQTNPSVAMDRLGNTVITWQSHEQDGNGWGIYARSYNALGVSPGGEFRVNTTTNGDQTNPSVAMDALGDFAVTWQGKATDKWGIYAQRFNALGGPSGGELQVIQTSSMDRKYPAAAMDDSGDLLITWTSSPYSGYTAVGGQQYTASGAPLGGPFVVNTSQKFNDTNASVAMNDQGNVVSVWAGGAAADATGVYMQRYNISFNGESSDGFYAQGDSNDPDQAGDPASTAPATVTPPPGDSAADRGGHDPLAMNPGLVDQSLNDMDGTSSHTLPTQEDLGLGWTYPTLRPAHRTTLSRTHAGKLTPRPNAHHSHPGPSHAGGHLARVVHHRPA